MSKNTIPPITDPHGKYWRQPAVSSILIDDTHALMSRLDFMKLAEYSSTIPTGVYDGKMWKRHDGIHNGKIKPEECKWLLCWYGPSPHPESCSINSREILIVEVPV